ncbi:MAG: alanine--tRNA ligase [Isosphaeraceae bacterium]
MKTDELREAFLEYFVSKGCVRRPSDVLVPNDKTVLFTPAGMNQFKQEFMGLGDPNFKRATTCQKCLRTGDIENVGKTSFHETFFEMLGNFSFGDYFKREAIHWAWEFLRGVLKLPADRLTITVYLDDDEAYNIWHDEIKIPADRITRMGEDDNFWPAGAPTHGPNGVCGPCSEIFYHGTGPKEVEIWNLVFTQFNRTGPGLLRPLPNKNIDTGMGLERAAACLQGVSTVFETDIFRPIVASVAEALGVRYDREHHDGVRIRRMADHSRALAFCIHENVQPGPNEQGYVIRRLLRRAVLDAYQMGRREPFLYQVTPIVAEVMSRPYPELAESVGRIQSIVKQEEEQFLQLLDNGLRLLNDIFRKTEAAGSDTISGEDAFTLHGTHGIPIEIVESLAADRNLRVDGPGFETARKEHAKVSRGTTEAADVFATGPLDTLKKEYHHGSEFVGYATTQEEARVIGILEQGRLAESARANGGASLALVLDRTPFYGESGGQVGDTGTIRSDRFTFHVTDTKKENNFVIHIGQVAEGEVTVQDKVRAEVETARRDAIRRAHSATHLLHLALRTILGKHAQQAGSKVEADRLRFDFSNPEAVGRDRLRAIEDAVNEKVLSAAPVSWSLMPIEQARSLGAMALFGEKYPDIVRVVQMGDFSRELCGGTHLDSVGQVGLFKIIGEESVATGVRRITALTGKSALDYIRQEEEILGELASTLRVPPGQVGQRVASLLEEVKTLKKQASERRAEKAPAVTADDLLAEAREIDGATVVVRAVGSTTADEMRQLIDVLRRKRETRLAVLLASAADGKVQLVAGLSKDLIKAGLHAGNWLKEVAPVVGGGGGGRPDLAQAGGKSPEQIPAALAKAIETIRALLEP